MNKLHIRNCETEDFNEVNLIMEEVQNLHVENRPDIYKYTNEVFSKDHFIDIVNNDKVVSIVAEINKVIVGVCIISMKEIVDNNAVMARNVAYMEDLCVLKQYRKVGVGSKLYNEGKKRILELGLDSLELMVWEFNKEAISFYKSQKMSTRSRVMELKL